MRGYTTGQLLWQDLPRGVRGAATGQLLREWGGQLLWQDLPRGVRGDTTGQLLREEWVAGLHGWSISDSV